MHTLKGGAGYCAAGQMFDKAIKILADFDQGNYRGMLEDYSELIEKCLIYRVEWRKVVAEYE